MAGDYDDQTLRMVLGGLVRRRRVELGYTQEGFAHAFGIDRSYLADIERGARNPGIDNVEKLLRALGIKPTDLRCD
jgi:transcriptional regulator with XRE-family HTH domain